MMTTAMPQIKWAWLTTKRHRSALFTYFLLEIVAIGLSLLFVLWSKRAIDIAMRSSTDNLKSVLILVVASVLVTLIIRSVSSWLMERNRLQMGLQLQRQMIELQMTAAWKTIKHWHTGDIQSRIHADCNEVTNMTGYAALSFLLTLVKMLASFAFLWSMDPMLALMIIALTPLFIFSKVYFKKMRGLTRQIKKEESNFWTILQENLRFRILIRAMDLTSVRRKKITESQEQIYTLKKEQLDFSTITQLAMKFTINIGYLITFIWGVYRLHTGQISFGTMTAFLQLVGRVQTPILNLVGFAPLVIKFRTAVERLMELAETANEPIIKPENTLGLKALYLDNLTFKYEDHPIINKLSMVVKRAEPTAIIGASGKGKTTLIRLLLALLQPVSGGIQLEDLQGKQALTAGHRANIAYVPQGNTLFSGTIRENLLMRNEQETVLNLEQNIKYSLWLACAEFVYDLPDGIDTVVGESGHGLSEGQAQRIAIARAMMRDCPIWLFDEVTSALDKDTASLLVKKLLQEGKNKLCIFTTHDLNLASKCSQTIYMN